MSEFFAMGGYGAYVWSAYAIVLAVLLWDATTPMRMRRALRRRRPARAPNRPGRPTT